MNVQKEIKFRNNETIFQIPTVKSGYANTTNTSEKAEVLAKTFEALYNKTPDLSRRAT